MTRAGSTGFGLMLHVPGLGSALQELGSAVRYRTAMTARIREIAILTVAAATESEFERYAHERVGHAVGLSAEETTALRSGEFRSEDPTEQAAYDVCRHLLAGATPSATRTSVDSKPASVTRRCSNSWSWSAITGPCLR